MENSGEGHLHDTSDVPVDAGVDEVADDVISSEEVVEGEVDVAIVGGRVVRVLIPAGVGVPGFDDAEVAGAVVSELLGRGRGVPDVVDLSGLLGSEPALVPAVEARLLAGD